MATTPTPDGVLTVLNAANDSSTVVVSQNPPGGAVKRRGSSILDDSALGDEPQHVDMTFGKGLLPDEAKAEFRPGLLQLSMCSNRYCKLDIGFLYVNVWSETLGYSFALGLDMDPGSMFREISNPLFWRAILAEFLGTLLFLYIALTTAVYRDAYIVDSVDMLPEQADETTAQIATSIIASNAKATSHLVISLVFGLTIFLLVYAFAPISGGHFNPAITWGLAATKKITVARAAFYSGAQLGGAVVGTLLAKQLDEQYFDDNGGGVNGNQGSSSLNVTSNEMFIAEVIGTFVLLTVVYCTVDPQRSASVMHISALGPLAIGLTITVCHLFLLPIDGCSVNPARSFGAAVVADDYSDHWVFWCGPFAGALLAALVNEIFFKGRKGFEDKWSK